MKKLTKSHFVKVILPIGSKRRRYVKNAMFGTTKASENTNKAINYIEWQNEVEPHFFNQSSIKKANHTPLISIVVPCYNTPAKYFDPLLESVFNQNYSNWQLCLADGSSSEEKAHYIEKLSKKDKRITYIRIDNTGIVGNSNKGIELATGEYVAFLDHDDTLSSHALSEVVNEINKDPTLDLIYSDEDKLSDDGKERLLPFFKPDWSPELLLGVNYITHFVVARKKIIDEIGGLRPGFDGAQDYDFLLRFTEKTNRIKHIPKILYHWRLADGSTAKNAGEKDYADTAGQRALRDAVKRRGIKAEVIEITERPTNYRLQYKIPVKAPKVSIIIPFKDKVEYLYKCIPSILDKSTYSNYEIILVSNNSTEPKTHDYLEKLKKNKRCKVFEWNQEFNYSKVNNFGRDKATGDYLIFLNNDTEVLTQTWIEELIGVASQQNIGAVGPLLKYPDKRIQHAGVVLGMGSMAGHVFRFLQPDQWTDFGMPCWPRNYLAVTGACLAVKATNFDKIGGFDETIIIAGSDVALCLRLHESGLKNIFWPFAELYHYESVSVGTYDNGIIGDYNRSLEYYRPYLNWNDPYFNPNLDLMNEQISIRSTTK